MDNIDNEFRTQHSESLRRETEIQIPCTSLVLDLHTLFLNVLNTNTEDLVSNQREMLWKWT